MREAVEAIEAAATSFPFTDTSSSNSLMSLLCHCSTGDGGAAGTLMLQPPHSRRHHAATVVSKWRLREIEESRPSDVGRSENLVEEYSYGGQNLPSLVDIRLTGFPKLGGATCHALPLPAFLKVACGGTSCVPLVEEWQLPSVAYCTVANRVVTNVGMPNMSGKIPCRNKYDKRFDFFADI